MLMNAFLYYKVLQVDPLAGLDHLHALLLADNSCQASLSPKQPATPIPSITFNSAPGAVNLTQKAHNGTEAVEMDRKEAWFLKGTRVEPSRTIFTSFQGKVLPRK